MFPTCSIAYERGATITLVVIFLTQLLTAHTVQAASSSTIRIEILTAAQCADGIDNDGDNLSDYPADTGCSSTTDTNETDTRSSNNWPSPVEAIQLPISVTFAGLAYPSATVALLKDGQLTETVTADEHANFALGIELTSGGNYAFGLYANDDNGEQSPFTAIPLRLTTGTTTNVSNVFLAPTLTLTAATPQGKGAAISGSAVPGASIFIYVDNNPDAIAQVTADSGGQYVYKFSDTQLAPGTHTLKTQAEFLAARTDWSRTVEIVINEPDLESLMETRVDFDGDNQVNLVDFSILTYWYQQLDPPTELDLNEDGHIDLTDFSILAYYWSP